MKPAQPLGCPLAVRLDFYFPRPKKHFKKAALRDNAPLWYVAKPDADNLAKAVLDALTAVGFWHDDNQVAKLSVRKLYTRQNGYTGCAVAINEITSDDQVHFRD
jgi:Holliday junction resolvase RusA-like endonuclease